MNITEDYCSFEVAKLLKEKGFNNFIAYGWDEQIFDKENPRYFSLNFDKKEHWISCPTHQMAMKWLREVYNRYIEICTDKGHNFVDIVFRPAVYDGDLDCLYESDNFPSYEQAVEAALKYSLENLI